MVTKEEQEMLERLINNPKIQKAMNDILAPLEQKGDSVTISSHKTDYDN